MNKELIRALTEYVISNRKEDEMNIVEVCCLIQEWFEQNPQNPVAQQPQFAIDWNNAPDVAAKASVFIQFYDKENVSLKCRDVLGNFERPKPPTPKVEFNQPYIHNGNTYVVDTIGKLKINDEWLDCVNYVHWDAVDGKDEHEIFTRTTEDFLANFERVEGDI